jgi:2'-5' RNA ligase
MSAPARQASGAASAGAAASAFVVRVPEAEAVVAELRRRYDASARLGMPAHITVLYPFMPARRITAEVLAVAAQAIAGVAAFRFALTHVGRFPATAYLAPEPAAPFVALTEALLRAFPAYPPFGGEHASIVPHLSAAHGEAALAQTAAAELAQRLQRHGPIQARCQRLSLLENSAGRWRLMCRLPLVQAPTDEGRKP